MKKKVLLLATLAVFVLLLVACAGGFDSIMFEKQPRTTYVQGQELDFTDTVLVAVKGDEKENLDLTAGDVTITGYDKNTLGKQTVTFTYGELTTSLIINVIPRMTFEGLVTDYFVGDEVNRAEGRIKVADDSGKTSTVNFNSDMVTTEDFDSSTAGTKTITVKYGGYTSTYSVNVYDVEKVELSKRPQKTNYDSHDTEFHVTGAYFTVTANGGALSRFVPLTRDNIKDFDPSKATVANITDRLPMTVKISYLGYEFDFDIFVAYSGVSYMQDVAEQLKDVTNPKACDVDTAAAAIEALTEYYTLSASEKALVDEDDTEKIALIVAYHGLKKFNTLIGKYSDSFVMARQETNTEEDEKKYGKYYGIFSLEPDSYEAASNAVKGLKGEDGKVIDSLASTLRSIEKEFPKLTIDGEDMDEYLGEVYTGDLDVLIGIFSVMVEVYDELSEEVIPKDWTPESLIDYKANIKKAVIAISDSEYNPYAAEAFLQMFKTLSTWREKDDVFHIISSYYITHEPDSFVDAVWEKVPLPARLNDLYLMIRYCIIITNDMRIGSDTTPFLYYYTKALELCEQIKDGDDAIEKEVFEQLGFEYLVRAYCYTGEKMNNIAYVYHLSGLVGNEKVEALIDKYIALVHRIYTDIEFDYTDADVVSASKELLTDFMALSAAERYGFLGTIHCDYRGNILDDSILACLYDDDKIISYNLFARLILNAYNETLSEEGFKVFAKLLVAAEHSSLYNFKVGGEEEFKTEMEQILADLEELDSTERIFLNNTFSAVFTIYEELGNPKNPDISASKDKIDELVELINRFYELYAQVGDTKDFEIYGGKLSLMIATYEKVRALADEILLSEDENAIYHYYYTGYTFNAESENDEDKFLCSIDFIVEELATISTRVLLGANIEVQYKEIEEGEFEDDYMTEVNAYYLYEVSNIKSFLLDAYELMWAQYKGTASELDTELVLSVMNKAIELDGDGAFAFNSLGVNELYHAAVLAAYEGKISAEAYAVLEKLIAVEIAYAEYATEDLERTLDAFKAALDELDTAYNALEDKTVFDSFKQIYDHYTQKYADAIAPEEGEGDETLE